ncbi:MAG: ABC transporter substrate-binding protein, partial [Hyphomicrobiaceae bacterium]
MSKCDVTRRVCKAWCSSLCAAACAGTARGSRAASFLAKGLAIAAALAATTTPATAVDEAAAAKGPPLTITLLVSSRPDACHDTGEVAAITGLATREAQRINTYGGIGGRPIAIAVLDDRRDEALTIANVGQALSAPNALAMVGVSASSRGKAVFEKLGSRIRAEGIPFISDLSVSSIFSDYPNVFTTRSSQDEERVPVIAAFIDRYRFSRPAFIGSADAVFSTALGDGLLRRVGADMFA